MNKWNSALRPIIGATSMLVIGIVIGIVIDRAIVIAHDGTGSAHVVVIGHDDTSVVSSGLATHLGLTEDESVAVHELLSGHQASVDTAWTAVREDLATGIERAMLGLDSLLDTDQRVRLREWLVSRSEANPVDAATTGN